MRKLLFIFTMLASMAGVAKAQQIYTYVQQSGTKLEQLGTASFEVSDTSNPTVKFVNGKAVMTIGENGTSKVAVLPMSDGGELVVEHKTNKTADQINKVAKTPTNAYPYVTIFSPFQLVVPDGCEVHAPIYNAETQRIRLIDKTKLAPGTVVPAETALLVTGNGEHKFTVTVDNPTYALTSALSGSSLKVDTPTDGTVFTFGVGKDGPNQGKYGFFRYTGSQVNPGLCYLKTSSSTAAKFIAFSFDDDVTGIDDVIVDNDSQKVRKVIENGRVVIVKGNKKFNVNGQEIF